MINQPDDIIVSVKSFLERKVYIIVYHTGGMIACIDGSQGDKTKMGKTIISLEQEKKLYGIADEMRCAFQLWDSRIARGSQPVPIQDLDFWKATLTQFLKEAEVSE